ncbi:M23 family metallopeptidase [Microbacterium oleivorans]|uniref:M23 family metallopeptidase n=1 Tax=Microbacterium oleivorans TaxID=273677 RepID=UPI0014051D0F|nr:M23 family metallopeptidase [Microbacterium oleivorans]
MSAAELLEFWDEDRWTRQYRYVPPPGKDNPYDLGYHIAQDVGGLTWTDPVPVLRAGTIVATGRSSSIGGFVVVQADDDGLKDWYCHLNTARMPKMGQPVTAGWRLPPLARSRERSAGADYMGSASSGPHLHFGVMTTVTNGYRPIEGCDRDPRPIIRAALRRHSTGSPAGGNATPISPEEDDMAWDDKLPGSNFTAGEALLYLFQQNTQGIPKRKTDGERVRAEKQIIAELAAHGAALDALARVIEKQSGGVVTKAEILAAVKSETSAGVKAALKNAEIIFEVK